MQKLTRFRFLFSFLFFLFVSTIAMGQVKGKVMNASGKPLPFCQVGLVNAADSNVVSVTSTDEAGKFEIERKTNGSFRVMVSYIGFKIFYSPVFKITNESKSYDAGNITLEADSKTLKNVDVVAQKPFREYKPDRTVYNIENSIIAAGNNALEILKKTAGSNGR